MCDIINLGLQWFNNRSWLLSKGIYSHFQWRITDPTTTCMFIYCLCLLNTFTSKMQRENKLTCVRRIGGESRRQCQLWLVQPILSWSRWESIMLGWGIPRRRNNPPSILGRWSITYIWHNEWHTETTRWPGNILCQKLISNETEAKLLVFGKDKFHNMTNTVMFSDKPTERTQMYKYLGNIFSKTRTIRGDVFKYTYGYLCIESQGDLFGLNKQLNRLWTLPPKLSLHLLKTNIEPILTYGSDRDIGYQHKWCRWNW